MNRICRVGLNAAVWSEHVKECGKPAKFVLSYVVLNVDAERVEASNSWDLCHEHAKKWFDPMYAEGYVIEPIDPKLSVML